MYVVLRRMCFWLVLIPISQLSEKLESRFKLQTDRLPKGLSRLCTSYLLCLSILLADLRTLQLTLLEELAKYQDLYLSRTNIETQTYVRDILSLHALNHIFR